MREANVKGMSAHLSSVFRHRYRFGAKARHSYQHRFLKLLNLRFYEAYLTFLYIGIKALFLLNVVIQTFLVNWFLQTNESGLYGATVLQDILTGREWTESGNFPRITYCDFDVRVLGNIQKHTVQCVLVINIFVEKIFVLLWVWYSFIAVVSLCSLVHWIASSIPFEARKRFIARRLELADVNFNRKNFQKELNEFVRDYIKMDGVFVLRMLTMHAGVLICTEVVDMMWIEFLLSTGKAPRTPAESPPATAGTYPGAAATTSSMAARRKASVFVPLLCDRTENYYLRRESYVGAAEATPSTPLVTGAAASGGGGGSSGLGTALAFAGFSRSLSHHGPHSITRATTGLLSRPNVQRWRMERQNRISATQERRGGRVLCGVQKTGGCLARRPRSSKFAPALFGVIGASLAFKKPPSHLPFMNDGGGGCDNGGSVSLMIEADEEEDPQQQHPEDTHRRRRDSNNDGDEEDGAGDDGEELAFFRHHEKQPPTETSSARRRGRSSSDSAADDGGGGGGGGETSGERRHQRERRRNNNTHNNGRGRQSNV